MRYANKLREKIAKGQLNFGTHCACTDPVFYELCGGMDYDYVWIDNEHGGMTSPMVTNAILATNAGGLAAMVRVVNHSVDSIKPVLEAGPDAMIFPMVNTAEQARFLVDICKYPPMGHRGFGPQRAIGYGTMSLDEYMAQANDSIMLIMQCESKESVDNLEEILAVPGVDGIICGPMDMSGSINKLGQLDDPEVMDLFQQMCDKCKKAGVPFGVSIGTNFKLCKYFIEQGASFCSIGTPQEYFVKMGQEIIGKIRDLEKECAEAK